MAFIGVNDFKDVSSGTSSVTLVVQEQFKTKEECLHHIFFTPMHKEFLGARKIGAAWVSGPKL